MRILYKPRILITRNICDQLPASFTRDPRPQHRSLNTIATALQQSNPAIDRLLDRPWLINDPSAPITAVYKNFNVIRDDLSHPYISGNKRRKLDAIFPELVQRKVTDVVTCGGSQSHHLLSVAASIAESNTEMKAHLLIRGERPAVPTGNHLFAKMFAYHVKYVSRSAYADRDKMFDDYVQRYNLNHSTTAIIPEGGAEVPALLGQIRLIHWLAREGGVLRDKPATFVVDCGTGTSAVGLALGIALLDLPWKVLGVMLAGTREYYEEQALNLVKDFVAVHKQLLYKDIGASSDKEIELSGAVARRLVWMDRMIPRKFGKILPGEVLRCKTIAREHGIIVDPVWTLSSWERAEYQAREEEQENVVYMVHTGGGLGLCGVAQRWPEEF